MVWPLWNNFLRSLLRFIVVRSGHDEELGRYVSDQSSSFFGGRKKKKEDTRKKKFINSVYMNVGRRSLDICSQAFGRVFACAVIHTAKRRTGWVLRS
jgi:hypothetical protein